MGRRMSCLSPRSSEPNLIIFFFSSRRRHTRSLCDWSSDVCSSDLKRWRGGEVQLPDAFAAWTDDAPTRERVWQLYLTTPPPLGYDPGDFWPAGPNDPAFGLLQLRPTRIDITGLASSPKPKLTWRPSGLRRLPTHPVTNPSKIDAKAGQLPTLSTGMTVTGSDGRYTATWPNPASAARTRPDIKVTASDVLITRRQPAPTRRRYRQRG